MKKDRLEPFSDCVFSIVATLLVIELKLPETGTVIHALGVIAPKLLVFVLSFIIVGTYWVAHHTLFNFIHRVDRNLLWLNNLNLLSITFLPFPTAVLGSHPFEIGAIVLYGATLILVNLTMSFIWLYASHKDGYMVDKVTPEFARRLRWLQLLPLAGYSLAIALADFVPVASLAIFVLVPAFFIIPNKWYRKATGGNIR